MLNPNGNFFGSRRGWTGGTYRKLHPFISWHMLLIHNSIGLWKLTALKPSHLPRKNAPFLSKRYQYKVYEVLMVLSIQNLRKMNLKMIWHWSINANRELYHFTYAEFVPFCVVELSMIQDDSEKFHDFSYAL